MPVYAGIRGWLGVEPAQAAGTEKIRNAKSPSYSLAIALVATLCEHYPLYSTVSALPRAETISSACATPMRSGTRSSDGAQEE